MARKTKEAVTKLRRICRHCGSSFKTELKTQHYCSPTCRNAASSARARKRSTTVTEKSIARYAKKVDRFLTSSFFTYVYNECHRAETVQILQTHTKASLLALFDLTTYRTRVSGFKNGKPTRAYHLSHICPVKGDGYLGALHPDNLVVTSAPWNQSHRNTKPLGIVIDAGLSFPTSSLASRYEVIQADSKEVVFSLIEQLLGSEWKAFVKSVRLNPSMKTIVTKALEKDGLSVPAGLSLDELEALADRHGVRRFKPKEYGLVDELVVLYDETKRHLGADSYASKFVGLAHDQCPPTVGVDSKLSHRAD